MAGPEILPRWIAAEEFGKIINEGDKQYKLFYGMSSHTAMNKYHGGVAQSRIHGSTKSYGTATGSHLQQSFRLTSNHFVAQVHPLMYLIVFGML